jgi:hypothetical protein
MTRRQTPDCNDVGTGVKEISVSRTLVSG